MEILSSINAGNRLINKWRNVCRFANKIIVSEDKNYLIKKRKLRVLFSSGIEFLRQVRRTLHLNYQFTKTLEKAKTENSVSKRFILHMEKEMLEITLETKRLLFMFEVLRLLANKEFKKWYEDYYDIRGQQEAKEILETLYPKSATFLTSQESIRKISSNQNEDENEPDDSSSENESDTWSDFETEQAEISNFEAENRQNDDC